MCSEAQMLDHYKTAIPQIFHLDSTKRHIFGAVADHLPARLSEDGRIHKILKSKSKYDPAVLEKCLVQLLDDTKLNEGLRSQIIPTKTYQGDAIRFTKIHEVSGHDSYADIEIRKAVMASCMHPLCYPSYPIELDGRTVSCLDGGLVEHPYHVYRKMKSALPAGTDIHMIMMSAGREKPAECSPHRFDTLGLRGMFHHSHGMPLVQEYVSAGDTENMKHLREDLGENLIEINYDLAPYFGANHIPQLDDAKPAVLSKYDEIAADVYKKQAANFDRIKRLLDLREEIRYAPQVQEVALLPVELQVHAPAPHEAFSFRSIASRSLMGILPSGWRSARATTEPATVHAPSVQ